VTRTMSKRVRYALGGVALGASLLLTPAVSYAAQDNWGQEVKACVKNPDCYNGGTRGEYVRDEARDESGRGYADEIHGLANPGKADPKPFE
jgi:hypothetical protein